MIIPLLLIAGRKLRRAAKFICEVLYESRKLQAEAELKRRGRRL